MDLPWLTTIDCPVVELRRRSSPLLHPESILQLIRNPNFLISCRRGAIHPLRERAKASAWEVWGLLQVRRKHSRPRFIDRPLNQIGEGRLVRVVSQHLGRLQKADDLLSLVCFRHFASSSLAGRDSRPRPAARASKVSARPAAPPCRSAHPATTTPRSGSAARDSSANAPRFRTTPSRQKTTSAIHVNSRIIWPVRS